MTDGSFIKEVINGPLPFRCHDAGKSAQNFASRTERSAGGRKQGHDARKTRQNPASWTKNGFTEKFLLYYDDMLQVPDVLIDSGYTVGFGCADFNGQTKGFAS